MARPFRYEAAGATDVGPMRSYNEDALGIFDADGLFLVADGMGGGHTGDVASRLAVEAMKEAVAGSRPRMAFDRAGAEDEARLSAAVTAANAAILAKCQERQYTGMGTTVDAILATPRRIHVAHVGDGRVHRLRRGSLSQLTQDHTLINDYRKLKPDLTPEEIAQIPANVITRALGMRPELEIEMRTVEPEAGDVYLLSTDGLYRHVGEADLVAILRGRPSLSAAAKEVVDKAIQNQADDNVTVVLVRVEESR